MRDIIERSCCWTGKVGLYLLSWSCSLFQCFAKLFFFFLKLFHFLLSWLRLFIKNILRLACNSNYLHICCPWNFNTIHSSLIVLLFWFLHDLNDKRINRPAYLSFHGIFFGLELHYGKQTAVIQSFLRNWYQVKHKSFKFFVLLF